jgi:hypothetical protein
MLQDTETAWLPLPAPNVARALAGDDRATTVAQLWRAEGYRCLS